MEKGETMDENMAKFVHDNVMGAYDLVPKDGSAPDPAFYFDWYKSLMTNPTSFEWKGYSLVSGFEAETAKYAHDQFVVKQGDVCVASYPKTGDFLSCTTTALRYTLISLLEAQSLNRVEYDVW